MISSESAIGASLKKSMPGFRNRKTSSCPGERRTCRRLQKKFKSSDSVWTKPRNLWRSDSVPREIKTKAPGKEQILKSRNKLHATVSLFRRHRERSGQTLSAFLMLLLASLPTLRATDALTAADPKPQRY